METGYFIFWCAQSFCLFLFAISSHKGKIESNKEKIESNKGKIESSERAV